MFLSGGNNNQTEWKDAVSKLSRARVSMGPGTLYGVLKRLQQDGIILLSKNDGRRKTYSITVAGKDALHCEYDRLASLVSDGSTLRDGDTVA